MGKSLDTSLTPENVCHEGHCPQNDDRTRVVIVYAGKEYGGGGNYTANLIAALRGQNGCVSLHCFFPQFTNKPFADSGHFHCSIYVDNTLGWLRMITAIYQDLRTSRVHACIAMDHRSLRLAPLFRALFPSVPWVYFLQSSLRMKKGLFRTFFRRSMFLFVKGICCVSHHVYQALREVGYVRNACVVYSAAPDGSVDVPTEISQRQSQNVVLLAGRMIEGKGHEDLLQAATGRDWTIWFAGDGGLLPEIREQCRDRTDVKFLGWVPGMGALYKAATVVVLPSQSEGLSLVVMEAMAHGKPVVAYDIESQRELITNEVTGVLVPVGDIQGLGEAIQGLLDDPERARQIGLRAQRYVRERFTPERMAYDTLRFVEKVRAS